jgi:hypothetical protein
MLADIFISYKSARVEAARHLGRILELHGWSVWFDHDLLSGKAFAPIINRELKEARLIIVLWCPLSVDSEWVQSEATFGRRQNKLLPALIAPTDIPVPFNILDTVNLISWSGSPSDEVLERLFAQIERQIGTPSRAHQRKALADLKRDWQAMGGQPLVDFKLNAAEAEEREAQWRLQQKGTQSPITNVVAKQSSMKRSPEDSGLTQEANFRLNKATDTSSFAFPKDMHKIDVIESSAVSHLVGTKNEQHIYSLEKEPDLGKGNRGNEIIENSSWITRNKALFSVGVLISFLGCSIFILNLIGQSTKEKFDVIQSQVSGISQEQVFALNLVGDWGITTDCSVKAGIPSKVSVRISDSKDFLWAQLSPTDARAVPF